MFCSPSTFFFSISVMEINVKSFAMEQGIFLHIFHKMISSPIFLMQENGITYSLSDPRKPQIFPGPGMTIASMQPLHASNTRSTGFPSLLQLQTLINFLFPQLTYPHFLPLLFLLFRFLCFNGHICHTAAQIFLHDTVHLR